MNRIFNLRFNQITGTWQCVPETAALRTKTGGSGIRRHLRRAAAAVFLAAAVSAASAGDVPPSYDGPVPVIGPDPFIGPDPYWFEETLVPTPPASYTWLQDGIPGTREYWRGDPFVTINGRYYYGDILKNESGPFSEYLSYVNNSTDSRLLLKGGSSYIIYDQLVSGYRLPAEGNTGAALVIGALDPAGRPAELIIDDRFHGGSLEANDAGVSDFYFRTKQSDIAYIATGRHPNLRDPGGAAFWSNIELAPDSDATLKILWHARAIASDLLITNNTLAGNPGTTAKVIADGHSHLITQGIRIGTGPESRGTAVFDLRGGSEVDVTARMGFSKAEGAQVKTTITASDAVFNLYGFRNRDRDRHTGLEPDADSHFVLFSGIDTDEGDTITIGPDGLTLNTLFSDSDGGDQWRPVVRVASTAGLSGSGAITKKGDNTLVITADNSSYSGTWLVAGGNLTLGGRGLLENNSIANRSEWGRRYTKDVTGGIWSGDDSYNPNANLGTGDVSLSWSSTQLTVAMDQRTEPLRIRRVYGPGSFRALTTDRLTLQGSFEHTGVTEFDWGDISFEGNITATRELDIGSSANEPANVTLKGSTTVRGNTVMRGDAANLTVDENRTLTTKNVLATTTGSVAFTLRDGALLDITENATLFSGFDTDRGDSITLGAASAIGVEAGKTATQAAGAHIGGSGDLVKTLGGTLTLTTQNRYAGETRIRGGRLVLNTAATAGTSTTAVDTGDATGAGTLVFNRTDDYGFTRSITGTGGIEKTGTGTVRLQSSETYDYTGSTDVRRGELVIGEGVRVDGSNALRIGALSEGTTAGVTLEGRAAFTGAIDLGEHAAKNTRNTLNISGATIEAARIARSASAASEAQVGVILSEGGTLKITQSSDMLQNFKASDTFELGDGGGAISVAAGARVVQTQGTVIRDQETSTHDRDLHKTGAGRLILTGPNTFTGKLYADEGILQAGNESLSSEVNPGGTGEIRVARGAVFATGFSDTWRMGSEIGGAIRQLTGEGSYMQAGSGTVIVDSAQQYGGDTLIRAGVLELSDGGVLGTGTSAIDTGEGKERGLLAFNQTGEHTWSRGLTGTGGIVKKNTGTLTLSSAEDDKTFTYSGPTRVEAGKLMLATDNSITGTETLDVSAKTDEATFTIQGTATVRDNVVLAREAAAGSLSTLELDGSTLEAANILSARKADETGRIRLSMKEGATVKLHGTGTLFENFDTRSVSEGGKGDVVELGTNGATLSVEAGDVITQAATAAISKADGATDTTLVKTGAGELQLAAKNTFGGKVLIKEGRLTYGAGGASTESSLTGNTDAVELASAGTNAPAQFAVNFSDTWTVDRDITGAGDFVQEGSGTTVVSRALQYSGRTLIRGGVLELSDGGGGLGTGTSAIDTGEGEEHGLLAFNQTGDHTWSRGLTGTGGIVKKNTGTLTLSSADAQKTFTYSGPTRVEAGKLILATGNSITGTESLDVSAKTDEATFTIQGTATVRDNVVLAREAAAGSLSTLELDGSTLEAANILSARKADETGRIRLSMKEGATVKLHGTGTLFENFDTRSASEGGKGDVVELGTNGATLSVEAGEVITQAATAAISKAAGATGTTLVKTGAGELQLAAKNTFGGKVIIKEGRLTYGAGGASTESSLTGNTDAVELASTTTNAPAQFAVNFSDTWTVDRDITGDGDFVQEGSGTTVVNRALQYSGRTLIRGGVLELSDGGVLGTGTSAIDTGEGDQSGLLAFNFSGRENLSTDDITVTRGITGTGGIRQTGTNRVILDTASASADGRFEYSGATEITRGELELASRNHITGTSSLTVGATDTAHKLARFTLKGTATVNGDVVLGQDAVSTSSNEIVLDGAILKARNIVRGNTTSMDNSVVLEAKNAARVIITQDGTLLDSLNTEGANQDRVYLGEGGAVVDVLEGVTATQYASARLSTRQKDPVTGDPVSVTGSDLIKDGKGTLMLTAKNDFTGRIMIHDGVLALGAGGHAADSALGGDPAADITFVETAPNASDPDRVSVNPDPKPVFAVNFSDTYNLAQKLTDENDAVSGSFVNRGTGTTVLTAANDYKGDTVVEHGIVQVGDYTLSAGEAKLGGQGVIELQNTDATLRYALAGDETVSRKITGAGMLSQDSASGGTLRLTGENDFSGDVEIRSGTLEVSSLSALGRGTNVVFGSKLSQKRALRAAVTSSAASPVLRITTDQKETLARNTSGSGSVVMDGTGLLVLSKDYSYAHTGETAIARGNMLLESGAGLPGSVLSTASGTAVRIETGAHEVAGLRSSAGSRLYVTAGSMTDYSSIAASGDVTLGGYLMVDVTGGEADFTGDKLMNVITAGGSLSGQFDGFADNSAIFNFVPEYHYGNGDPDGNAMHLVIMPDNGKCSRTSGPLECIVRSYADLRAVPMARVLDREFAARPSSEISRLFYRLPTDEAADRAAVEAMPLLSGGMVSAIEKTAERLNRMTPVRSCADLMTPGGNRLWVNIAQHRARQDAEAGATGRDADETLLALGAERCLREGTTQLGWLFGYAQSDIESRGNQSQHSADADQYQIGLYGSQRLGESLTLDFRAGYARALVDGRRELVFANRTARSSYSSNVFYAGAGLNFPMAAATPYMRVDLSTVRSSGYHESGAGVLNYTVESQKRNSAVLEAGLRFGTAPAGGRFTFGGRIAAGYELLDSHDEITAAFEGIRNARFTTESPDYGRLRGTLELN